MKTTHFVPACLAAALVVLGGQPAGAVNLWYDFEDDVSPVIADKLADDGAHDAELQGNVALRDGGTIDVPFGSKAALFQPPEQFNPPYATIEVPGSDVLGDTFTLALHADVQKEAPGSFRIFSNYGGTGAVPADRMILDFIPSTGLRAIVGGTVVSQTEAPSFPSGYHHYALTVDNGQATLYFNGSEVGAGTVPTDLVNSLNLRVGEDVHDVGGSANEQLTGHVDDVLVLDEVLSPSTIAQLASGAPAQSVVTPTGSYAVNYNFEGVGAYADRFVDDGAQSALPSLGASIASGPSTAREGTGAARLDDLGTVLDRFSQLVTPVTGTDLGDQFTLSSVVNVPQGGFAADGLVRLFSTYAGGGSAANALILDFNPDADIANIGIRLILPGRGSVVFPGQFSFGEDHTITAVYDNGEVSLYLDGTEVATQSVDPGEIDLGSTLLRIGEDTGGAVNENFLGVMDDVLILDTALTDAQVRFLAREGFANLQAIPEPASAVLICLLGGVGLAVRRRLPR